MKRAMGLALVCAALLSGCGVEPRREEEPWVRTKEKAYVFSDGQYVDLWEKGFFGGRDEYRLPDGRALLLVMAPTGPDRVYVGGAESFDDLNDTAQQSVMAFYEEQGLLYDVEAELERAYAWYLECTGSGEDFNSLFLEQLVSPTGSNDSVICFLTSVVQPVNGNMAHDLRLGAVFEKETGEHVEGWELFAIPEQEIRDRFGELFRVEDRQLAAQMGKALKPEYFVLFPEHIEVSFPHGTLEGQEYSHMVAAEYSRLSGVIRDRVVIPK